MAFVEQRKEFAVWLAKQGIPDAHVEKYVKSADRFLAIAAGAPVKPKHVDEAVRKAESAGATPHQLANLQRMADMLMQFQRDGRIAVATGASLDQPLPAPPGMTPSAFGAVAFNGFAPATPPGSNVVVASASGSAQAFPPLPAANPFHSKVEQRTGTGGASGCKSCGGLLTVCYPGNGMGSGSRAILGGGGLVGAVLGYLAFKLLGCGVIAIALLIGSVVSLIGGIFAKQKCTRCGAGASAADLSEDYRKELRGKRIGLFVTAGATGVGGLLVGVLWIGAAVWAAGGLPESAGTGAGAGEEKPAATDEEYTAEEEEAWREEQEPDERTAHF